MASVPYVFTLEVDGFDIEDDDVISRFSADAVEAYPAVTDGQVTVTYSLLSDYPFDAVLDAINHLRRFDPGIHVQRVLPDLVNISDIASRISIPRDTVRSWVTSSRGPGNFPQPYATIGRGVRIWDWSAVNEWLRTNHPGLNEDEQFLSREQLDWINASLARTQWNLRNSGILISGCVENLTQTTQGPSLNADLPGAGFYTVLSASEWLPQTPTSSPLDCLLDLSTHRLIQPFVMPYSRPCLSPIIKYDMPANITEEELSSSGNVIFTGMWHYANISETDMNEDSESQSQPTTAENTMTKVASSPGNSSTSLVVYPSSQGGDRP